MKLLGFSLAFLGLVAGCAPERGNLLFRDDAGQIVATGDLHLPQRLAEGQQFHARWKLRSASKAFPRSATKSGIIPGIVNSREVHLNLHPFWVDNNVHLYGALSNGSLNGTWSLCTFPGQKKMGSFMGTQCDENAR